MLDETGLWRDVTELSSTVAVALAGRLGLERGLDVDTPAWTEAYYRVARRTA